MYVSPEPMLEHFEVGFKSSVALIAGLLVLDSVSLTPVEGWDMLVVLEESPLWLDTHR